MQEINAQNINEKLILVCRLGSYQNGKTALSYFLMRMESKFHPVSL
jgi:hypothetical protein